MALHAIYKIVSRIRNWIHQVLAVVRFGEFREGDRVRIGWHDLIYHGCTAA